MKKVIVYPGRFQPMLSHHAEVYRKLQAAYPDAEVYIGSSDKVEMPKSPFNFSEKQQIAQAHGIDPKKVLQVSRPYHKDDYPFDEKNTVLIFAVGEKDLDRFPFNNVDPKTGLDMTLRGEERPKYYQKLETMDNNPLPMSDRGYITLAPTVKIGDEVASASAFRKALQDSPDIEAAKQLFTKQFGEYNEQVFQLIYDKIVRAKMNEDLNILKQLSGLPVTEAPVDMRPAHGDSEGVKLLVGVGHLIQREANNRPMGKGTPDSELAFQNKMSEIGGQLVSGKYESMPELVADIKSIADIDGLGEEHVNEFKQLFLDMMKAYKEGDRAVGLKPGEKSEYDIEGDPDAIDTEEGVDLADIRSEYGIEEDERLDEFVPLLPMLGAVASFAGRAVLTNIPRVVTGMKKIADVAKTAVTSQQAKGAASAVASATGKTVGAITKGVGKAAVKNPVSTAAVGASGYLGYKANDNLNKAADAIDNFQSNVTDKISGGVDAVKDTFGAAGNQLEKVYGSAEEYASKVAEIAGDGVDAIQDQDILMKIGMLAKQYALPFGLVIMAIWGGKKVLGMIFDDVQHDGNMVEGDGTEHHCNKCDGDGCDECDDTGVAKEYQEESIEKTSENALDAALAELRQLSGL